MGKEVLSVWRKIYSNWRYTLSVFIILAIFLFLNVIIKNYSDLKVLLPSLGFVGSLKFLLILTIGFHQTVLLSSYITTIIIGLLTGMLLTIVFYRTRALSKHENKKGGVLASVGLFLGIAAPGCAACGVGLLAVFGVTAAALSALPLKGLEISLLSIGILGFSIWNLSKGLLECKTCKISLNDSNLIKKSIRVKGG